MPATTRQLRQTAQLAKALPQRPAEQSLDPHAQLPIMLIAQLGWAASYHSIAPALGAKMVARGCSARLMALPLMQSMFRNLADLAMSSKRSLTGLEKASGASNSFRDVRIEGSCDRNLSEPGARGQFALEP